MIQNKNKKIFLLLPVIILFGFVFVSQKAQAATRTWSGTTSTVWTVGTNWSEGTAPTSADDVVINIAAANQPTLDVNAGSVTINSLSVGSSAASTLTISNGSATKKLIVTGNVTVGGSGTITHTANTTAQTHVLVMDVGGDMTISVGGKIDTNTKGFAGGTDGGNGSGTGFGYGLSDSWDRGGSGAGYGGLGGRSNIQTSVGAIYGSLTASTDLGSGGGSGKNTNYGYSGAGGAGGGAIKLNVSGILTVSGSITANGATGGCGYYSSSHYGQGGGGSGGSIWIIAGTLAGTGSCTANGGGGQAGSCGAKGGGGAGGRIAIEYATNTFSGTKSATGGTGYQAGGAGTIYTKAGAANGDLVVTNSGVAGSANTTQVSGTNFTFDNVTISNQANYVIPSTSILTAVSTFSANSLAASITINSGGTLNLPSGMTALASMSIANSGTVNFNNTLAYSGATFTNNGSITGVTSLTLSSATVYQNGTITGLTDLTVGVSSTFEFQNLSTSTSFILNNLTIQNGGTVTHQANGTTQTDTLNLVINNNLDIQTGGKIDVAGKGFAGGTDGGNGSGTGFGYGLSDSWDRGGSGAGYGGLGGRSNIQTSVGAIYGSLTASTDLGSGGGSGKNTNYGYSGAGGAGGGAIKLNVSGILTVSGSITANGATGGCGYYSSSHYGQGGGGSGGSIWIIAGTLAGTGSCTANGGGGQAGSCGNIGGGGAGGRIAIEYATNTFSGTKSAAGGSGYNAGSVGTIRTGSYYGELISSPYNTQNDGNLLGDITWTENLPSGTDARFQLRTSPDNSTWTSWLGPDGTSSSYFTDPTGNTENVPAVFLSGNNDRWVQYKLILTSPDLSVNPVVSDITLYYVGNNNPQFDASFGTGGSTTAQVSNSADANWGKVKIDYAIKDIDTTSGSFTPNYVTPTFEYTLNGTTWNEVSSANIAFGDAPSGGGYSTYNGNTTNKVLEGSYLTYTAYWDAKTQIPENYSTNFKVRAIINDNEAANNTAQSDGNTTSLDTKNPVAGAHPILINASTSPATATLAATDDSTLKMDVNLTNSFASILTTAYNSSPTIALATDPDTVYVKYQDIYGNTSSAYSITSPETPTAMMVQDTTNMDTTPIEYRLFLAWKANVAGGFGSYKIYRSENQSDWDLKYTQTDPAINYYSDSSMTSDTKYYYKAITTDADGNISYNSATVNGKANGTQDAGEGGGGAAPGDFPAISEVTAGTPASTSVTITWETDDPADSVVQYMTDTGGDFEGNNALSKGKATLLDSDANLGDHSVTLTGLSPDTIYYYQVVSTSAAGATTAEKDGVNGYSFTTASGPAISNVTVSSETNDSAAITWTTTGTNSTSYVYYSTSPVLASPAKLGNDTLTASHSISIGGLSADTTYYFKVESTDGNSAASTDDNGGNYYTFTANDSTGPVISGRAQPIKTYESVAIYWATDENSTSQVRYSAASGGPYTSTAETAVYDRGHYVVVSSLSADTGYYYKVYSKDIAGNETLSSEQTFATLKDPSQQHDPLSEITGIDESLITDENAVVKFETDQPSLCLLEATTSKNIYSNPLVAYEDGYDDEENWSSNHSIKLTGLIFSTTYYYRITCHDNLDTIITEQDDDNYSLTTLEQQYGSSEIPDGDTTAPEISGVGTSSITGESVTVSWDTDEEANSMVSYGIKSGTYDNQAGNYDVNSDSANFVTSHEVIINNLTPGTKYYYVVMSTDASGNIGESDESTFTTKAYSNISSIKPVSTKLGEVTITWKTSAKTTSIVEYGTTTSYGESKESSTYATDHEITISGLKQSTEYHFMVKGKDQDNNVYASGDNSFTPKSPPSITNVKLLSSTEHEATVTFTTSVATDALITYASASDDKDTGSQGQPELKTAHEIILKNLTAGTTYSYAITVKDIDGNSTTDPSSTSGQAGSTRTFTTGVDTIPPKIDQVRTDSALAQNDKVQTIISWVTDELSNTAIIYKEGQNAEAKEVKISDNPTTSHIAVITIFKPGTVYYFKVKSTDLSQNSAASSDFALLTPKRKENIVQIIVANFQDIFNWARFGS